MAITLAIAVLVVTMNLVADILYGYLDPRCVMTDLASPNRTVEHLPPTDRIGSIRRPRRPIDLTEKPESLGRQAWERFRRHKLALVGAGLLVFLITSFWVGEWLSPYEISETNVPERSQGPSLSHPFGTDPLGRDYFVRSMVGGQFSIFIAAVTAFLATTIGMILGSVAGYFGGWTDSIVSFVINMLLTFPLILVLVIFGREFGAKPIVGCHPHRLPLVVAGCPAGAS